MKRYTTKDLKDIYNQRYAESRGHLAGTERENYRIFREFLLKNKRFKKVLDIGCGVGHKTKGFTHVEESVVAIDLSEKGIERAKENYSSANHLTFEVANALELEGTFDLICAFGFSLFNTNQLSEFLQVFQQIQLANLKKESNATMVIGSFTDGSGTGEDSWYMHTKAELKDLQVELSKQGFEVQIIFPHKFIRYYFLGGMVHFLKHAWYFMFKPRKTFFILISRHNEF